MIIDGVNNLDLGIGAGRRIVEPGDSQQVVPNILLPILLGLRPHALTIVATSIPDRSRIVSAYQSRTNQAAISTVVLNLPPGLYELELGMALASNFTHAFATDADAILTLENSASGFQVFLIAVMASIGTISVSARYRILIHDACTVNMIIGLTGVGQSVDQRVTVNAIRIL